MVNIFPYKNMSTPIFGTACFTAITGTSPASKTGSIQRAFGTTTYRRDGKVTRRTIGQFPVMSSGLKLSAKDKQSLIAFLRTV
jgi:hypothetical protein